MNRKAKQHIAHQWMLATGVPEQNVTVLWEEERERIWVVVPRATYRMDVGSDDAQYAFAIQHGLGPELVTMPLIQTRAKRIETATPRRDRYTAWAWKWGRGEVRAIHLPITNGWAIGSDETHLATYEDPPHVITFATEVAANRIVNRANRIIRREV